jgi:hypothetical protein
LPATFGATSLIPPTAGKFLEELIKKWSLLQAQTSAIDQAVKIGEEAGCCLLQPGAVQDLHKQVNNLSINSDENEVFNMVADFYHNHPAMCHLPQATETTHSELLKEDQLATLAALHEEQELRKTGWSISTSTGKASVSTSLDEVFCFSFLASLPELILILTFSQLAQPSPTELSFDEEEKGESKEEAQTQSQDLFGSRGSQIIIPSPFTPASTPTETISTTPISKSTSILLHCLCNTLTI